MPRGSRVSDVLYLSYYEYFMYFLRSSCLLLIMQKVDWFLSKDDHKSCNQNLKEIIFPVKMALT